MASEAVVNLTRREREVLSLIGQGFSLAQIAEKLYRSQKTIQTHRLSLGKKLGVSNRVELARIAIREGLAPLEVETPLAQSGESQDRDNPSPMLVQVLDSLAGQGGPIFFRSLVEVLCDKLDLMAAGISELSQDRKTFSTPAISIRGKMAEEISYPLAHSACEAALREKNLFVQQDAQHRFPLDEPLKQMQGEGYIGIRLDGDKDLPIGVLWAVHDQPINPSKDPLSVFTKIAPRAAAELERWTVMDQLHELREDLEVRVEQRTAELSESNRQLRATVQQLARAQDKAQAEEARFHQLVEMINDGFGILDAEGKLTYANPTLCKILGRDQDQLLGFPHSEWMNPDESKEFWDRLTDRPQSEADRDLATCFQPDGEQTRVIISSQPLTNEAGEFDGAYAIITPLTDSDPPPPSQS